jgi:hypothetical protein
MTIVLHEFCDPLSPFLNQKWQRLEYRRLLWSSDPHCLYCGRRLRAYRATLDHVHPVSRGGTHHIGNLALSCAHCNLAKAERTLVEWLADLERALQSRPIESGVPRVAT